MIVECRHCKSGRGLTAINRGGTVVFECSGCKAGRKIPVEKTERWKRRLPKREGMP